MTDQGADTGAHAHVAEAIRHLRLAADTSACGVCQGLYEEEIAHLEMADELVSNVEAMAQVQVDKREQLTIAAAPAGKDLAEVPLTREYVEERVHTGPEGTHREIVRGVETEPQKGDGFIRSFMRNRPRLTDMLPNNGR